MRVETGGDKVRVFVINKGLILQDLLSTEVIEVEGEEDERALARSSRSKDTWEISLPSRVVRISTMVF